MHPESSTDSANRRVLLIDDNPAIHRDIAKILRPAGGSKLHDLRRQSSLLLERMGLPGAPEEPDGFELVSAFQGEEGVLKAREAAIAEKPFALAIVDCRMPPGMDGMRTIEELWSLCPDLQIVFCTAYADYSWEEIAGIIGSSDGLVILKKPFEVSELRQLVESMTQRWSRNEETRLRLQTLRRQSEQGAEALEESRRRLEKALREAGAAQAAAEALKQTHHLLDVLDESVARLSQRLQKSKVGCIGRLAGVLRDHEAHLGAFGRKLPVFLSDIGMDLTHERNTSLQELMRLRQATERLRDLMRFACQGEALTATKPDAQSPLPPLQEPDEPLADGEHAANALS
jgi:two-component system sensor histidine kinase/response regulator